MRLNPGPTEVEVFSTICDHEPMTKQLFDERTGGEGRPFLDRGSPVQMSSLITMRGEKWT